MVTQKANPSFSKATIHCSKYESFFLFLHYEWGFSLVVSWIPHFLEDMMGWRRMEASNVMLAILEQIFVVSSVLWSLWASRCCYGVAPMNCCSHYRGTYVIGQSSDCLAVTRVITDGLTATTSSYNWGLYSSSIKIWSHKMPLKLSVQKHALLQFNLHGS